MSVTLVDGVLRQGGFAPSAAEIFAVFEDEATELRGVPVTPYDFRATGLRFVWHTAVPMLELRQVIEAGLPSVRCWLVGEMDGEVAEAALAEGASLDYAIIGETWCPLPPGTGEEVAQLLKGVGARLADRLSLRQYFELLQLSSPPIPLRDLTGGSMAALGISSSLPAAVPAGFVGRLFPYQQQGVSWLCFMHREGLGGLLADEMGLGKSVQVICLILASHAQGGRNLVIAPATLLENWRREFLKFAPSLQVLVHRGARRAGLAGDLDADVVVTSFETAVSDVSLLSGILWDVVVIDEAQGIKNPTSRRSQTLKRLRRRTSLAVTGTPVENSLTDLWSLMDFVVPGHLGDLARFERDHPDTLDAAAAVEARVSPLILRRRVADVAADLPERIDIPVAVELTEAGAGEYESIRLATVEEYGQVANLVAVTKLRRYCAHPWLADLPRRGNDPFEASPKLQRLREIMEEIVANGGKALVFAAYSEAIDLVLGVLCREFRIPGWSLDGRTPVPTRQEVVDAFSAVTGSALLVMNPRAAGVGLNIVAAAYVIHYTPEWNPALEDQASARAHRRGQTQVVRVFTLSYVRTVEEVMEDRTERKRELAGAAVVGTDGENLDAGDLLRALAVSPMQHP